MFELSSYLITNLVLEDIKDDLIVKNCKVTDVYFREANLNHASFIVTDLQNSLFMRMNLKHADFTDMVVYFA